MNSGYLGASPKPDFIFYCIEVTDLDKLMNLN